MLNVLRWGETDKAGLLVAMCHGVGADASQMQVFVDAWAPSLPRTAFLAPDAPEPFDYDPSSHQWFSLADRTPAVLDAGARRAAPLLDAAVDAECARLGLSPDRVAMVGFSQGAMMVLHAGLRRRPAPGAILAYSGALLDRPELGRLLSGKPPVLLVHGEADDVVPFARGREAAESLQRLGVPVETCWCSGVGHYVDDTGLRAGLAALQRLDSAAPSDGAMT
jgi:phospholipase/carboxylesterase